MARADSGPLPVGLDGKEGRPCSRPPLHRVEPERRGGGLAASCPGSGARGPEVDCKPGPVPASGHPLAGEDHSSRRRIATPLERSNPGAAEPRTDLLDGPPSTASLFELAPGGACLAAGHPAVARGLLPHDFTLTPTCRGGISNGAQGRFETCLYRRKEGR